MSGLAAAVGGVPGTTLPVVDEAHAPAYVRNGSAAVKHDYATAVGFEEMLLSQLTQSLAQSSGLSGESEEAGGEASAGEEGASGSESGGGMLAELLPQTLAEGLTRDGGLGMASQLMGALDPGAAAALSPAAAATATAHGAGAPTGGTSA
jgi:hypothetical protein